MILKVQNISISSPSINLFITFVYDEKMYKINKNYLPVNFKFMLIFLFKKYKLNYLKKLPILVPGLEYPFSTYIHSISNQLISDNIKVIYKQIKIKLI